MALAKLITELRRRRVFRAAGVYIVAAWVALQVASLLFPAIKVPENALLFVWVVALFLFPVVLLFAWFYDITSSGIARTAPAATEDDFDPSLRQADYVILAALAVVALAVTVEFSSRIESTMGAMQGAARYLEDLDHAVPGCRHIARRGRETVASRTYRRGVGVSLGIACPDRGAIAGRARG